MTKSELKELEELLVDGEVPEDYWVFGFDTMHAGDTLDFWNLNRCVEEINNLKSQLENYTE